MHLTKRLNLRSGERVVAITRRSWLAYATPILLAVLSIFLAFFLIVPLFARGWFGVAIFILLLALTVAMALRAVWFWYWTALVITDDRIVDIDQRGFFHRKVSDVRFDRVEDIAIEIHGITATMFHLGTIRIQTSGAHALIELRAIPKPEVVQELLSRLQTDARHRAPTSPPMDLQLSHRSAPELTQLRERIDVELRRRDGGEHTPTV